MKTNFPIKIMKNEFNMISMDNLTGFVNSNYSSIDSIKITEEEMNLCFGMKKKKNNKPIKDNKKK